MAALRCSSELMRGHFEMVLLAAAFTLIVEEAVTDGGALVGLVSTFIGQLYGLSSDDTCRSLPDKAHLRL